MEVRKVIEPQRSRRSRREEDRACQNEGRQPVETDYRLSVYPAHQTTLNPNELGLDARVTPLRDLCDLCGSMHLCSLVFRCPTWQSLAVP